LPKSHRPEAATRKVLLQEARTFSELLRLAKCRLHHDAYISCEHELRRIRRLLRLPSSVKDPIGLLLCKIAEGVQAGNIPMSWLRKILDLQNPVRQSEGFAESYEDVIGRERKVRGVAQRRGSLSYQSIMIAMNLLLRTGTGRDSMLE
jgi:hypothetical protein